MVIPVSSLFIFLLFLPAIAWAQSSSPGLNILNPESSLSVEKEGDFLVSPNETFSSGFYKVGNNAYCFSIWYTNSIAKTVVWMANRENPVNGKKSRLTLHSNGNLILADADGSIAWSTNKFTDEFVQARLLGTGNLVLVNQAGKIFWQSFDSPTDTLLPLQRLVKNTTLVSIKSPGTYSSGFFNLKFDDNNVLDLLFNGVSLSSIYWPNPGLLVFANGRTSYNSSRIAVFDKKGRFVSSDNLGFDAADYGLGPQRRLTLDYDGVLRMYSLDESSKLWSISWVPYALQPCLVQGLCGEYGICSYSNRFPSCACPSGFTSVDPSDWTKGCKPMFNLSCKSDDFDFIELPNTDYYGYDLVTISSKVSYDHCRNSCLTDCLCKGFGYATDGSGNCYPKGILLNGYQLADTPRTTHIKVPKGLLSSLTKSNTKMVDSNPLSCSASELVLNSDVYGQKTDRNKYMKYLIIFVIAIGVIELIFIALGWWFVFRKQVHEEFVNMGYILLAMGFKRFTYAELKRATKNFKQEIGKGGFGTVYKGVLDDERVVAIKRLDGILQGDAEFWAEVSIIGKLNHRNLVKLWGFCAENDHKMLVYEYVSNGSLDKFLFSDSDSSGKLGFEQRYRIAVGTAKGLSYLHEECLEWVLHCDVKPQNILLDDEFEPKVADFGMSKLFKEVHEKGFSRVRGTRGYLAPEWMMNLKIDAKADVYSYGIVLLELVSGKSASTFQSAAVSQQKTEFNDLIQWVSDVVEQEGIVKVIDPNMRSEYDEKKVERLLNVALLCVAEDRNVRPPMSKVVELLLGYEESRLNQEAGLDEDDFVMDETI